MHLLALFPFEVTDFLPFSYTSNIVKSLRYKRCPFRAESPRIGHYLEYRGDETFSARIRQHSNVTGLSLQISGTGKTPLGCGLFGLPIKRRFKFCLHCVIDYKERWRETYIKNDISTPDQLFIII